MPTCMFGNEASMARGRLPGQRTTPLAQWLTDRRQERGLTMTALAEMAGVTHARVSQIEAGGTTKRDTIERLASALTPDGADPVVVRAILNEGLRAAGFTPRGEDEAPDIHILQEAGYSDLTQEDKEAVAAVIRALKQQRAGAGRD